jgi:S1-C subfamily serine protease
MVVASLESWESRLIAQGVFAAKPTEEAEKRVVGEVTLRRVVQEAVETERARNRKIGVIAVVLLVLTIATLTLTMWTKTERTAVPDVPAAAVTENESLDPESWANAVERLAPSIFLCYGNDPETGVQALGTAFAIGPEGKLATNAHVVRLLEKLPVRMVVQNDTGRVFPILRMQSHPDYHEATGPDLALLQIDTRGQKLPIAEIATTEELRKLRIGTQLGTLGFPAELQQTYLSRLDRTRDVAPGLEATFKTGWIGRIVNASGVKAGFEESIRIQHSASLSGGTSGSPMFTSNGHVVAINHSGLDYAVVTAEDESKPKKVERILNPAQIGHALRIDVLEKFRNDVRW